MQIKTLNQSQPPFILRLGTMFLNFTIVYRNYLLEAPKDQDEDVYHWVESQLLLQEFSIFCSYMC